MVNRVTSLFLIIFTTFGVSHGAPKHDRRIVCYMASWSIYFDAGGRFDVTDAERAAPFCTHIVLLFASLDENTLEISSGPAHRELIELGGIAGVVKLKESHPHLKVMICIGGWNDGSVKYSRMARDAESRKKFVASVDRFLSLHKLDGIDLNWQFPGDRGGVPEDKKNLVFLVQELRAVLDLRGLLVSVAVSAFPWRIDLGVDGGKLAANAHFINILSYEYNAKWGMKVGASAPLNSYDQFSVNNTVSRYVNEMGASAEKLNLGLSAYGTTYMLVDPDISDDKVVGATVNGGFFGKYNGVDGFISYNELCEEMKEEPGWNVIWDDVSRTPFARNKERVASFDNDRSFDDKIKMAMDRGLGGVIFYDITKDDFKGLCDSGTFPLLRSINQAMLKYSTVNYDDLKVLLKTKFANFFWSGSKSSE